MKAVTENTPRAVILGLGINGLGIVRSLAQYRVPSICIDSNFFNPWGFTRYCKKVKYQDLSDENLVNFLIEFAKKERLKPTLFITIDENVLMLSKHRDELKKYFWFILPERESLETLMNKKLFSDFARKEGFPIPETFSASSVNEINRLSKIISYPCIMKPHFRGKAWEKSKVKGAFKIKNAKILVDTYRNISSLNKNVIVQEWISGPDSEIYFCLTYFNSSNKPLAHFVGKKIRQWPPECGSTSLAMSCEQSYILKESIRLFKTIGLRGFGSVEFKRDSRDRKFKITEPTVGRTNLQSAIALAGGVNIPYIAYMDMTGNNHLPIPKQINGIKWLIEANDFYSCCYYIKNKELNLKQWLRSLKGKKSFAIFTLADPMPVLFFLFSFPLQLVWKCFTKLNKTILKITRKTVIRKRDLFSKIMDSSKVLELASSYRKKTNREWLTILAYHRVIDYSKDILFDFDEELISVSPENFEAQIKWLKNYFNIISFDSLHKNKIKSNSLIITFDDGYKDNFENAYPVLKKYNIPATIFLSTGYIGKSELFWWDEVAYLINKTAKTKLTVVLERPAEYVLITEKDRKNAILSLLKFIKRMPNEKRKEIIHQLRENLEVNLRKTTASALILNWDEIREMSKNGLEFGTHSVTHPVLVNLRPQIIKYEIEESKKKIEQEINKDVTIFAYPVGGINSFDYRVARFLEQAGYLYAVTSVYGRNSIFNLNNFYLKRIPIEKKDILSTFKSKIIFPNVIKY